MTAIIERVCEYLPAGQKIWLEYSNEHWNTGFPYAGYFSSLGAMTGISRDAFYTGRAAAVHSLAESVMTGLGRGGDLVRVFGSWIGGRRAATPRTIVSYANANNIRIDALRHRALLGSSPAIRRS